MEKICERYMYSLYIFKKFLNQTVAINFLEFPLGVKFRNIGIFRGEQQWGGIWKIRLRLYLRLP